MSSDKEYAQMLILMETHSWKWPQVTKGYLFLLNSENGPGILLCVESDIWKDANRD